MAYVGRIGSRLKVVQYIGLAGSKRCMSTSKIFVGGIPQYMNDQDLRQYFDKFGQVVKAWIPFDRELRMPRKFGFVVFSSEEAASAAVHGQNGKELLGRKVFVDFAFEQGARSSHRGTNYVGGDCYYGGYDAGVGYGGYGRGFLNHCIPYNSTNKLQGHSALYNSSYDTGEIRVSRSDNSSSMYGRYNDAIGGDGVRNSFLGRSEMSSDPNSQSHGVGQGHISNQNYGRSNFLAGQRSQGSAPPMSYIGDDCSGYSGRNYADTLLDGGKNRHSTRRGGFVGSKLNYDAAMSGPFNGNLACNVGHHGGHLSSTDTALGDILAKYGSCENEIINPKDNNSLPLYRSNDYIKKKGRSSNGGSNADRNLHDILEKYAS